MTVGSGMPLDRQLMYTNVPTSAASSSGGLTMIGKAVRRNQIFFVIPRVYMEYRVYTHNFLTLKRYNFISKQAIKPNCFVI